MNDLPPIGGFGSTMHQTAAKLRELIDLDKASADEIRRWTLVGIVDLTNRMGQIEKFMQMQDQTNRDNRRLILTVGGLAWIALIGLAFVLARVI